MLETPSQLPYPSFVMNFPFSLSTEFPNNKWMKQLSPRLRQINKPKAYRQFMDLYNFVSSSGLVYLLPSYQNLYQDLVYISSIGIYLPHITDRNIIILGNFTSKPRQGEESIGKPFFELMNYETINCPHKWEGEAELKYLYDNIYIGGYGIRSEIKAYEWMEEKFNMKIIKLKMTYEGSYHLDCSVFPLTPTKTLVSYNSNFTKEELIEISKVTEIINIGPNDLLNGLCNSVRINDTVLSGSGVPDLTIDDHGYEQAKESVATLEKLCAQENLEPVIFNMSEFGKSGAALSCLFMHLNYNRYNKIKNGVKVT